MKRRKKRPSVGREGREREKKGRGEIMKAKETKK